MKRIFIPILIFCALWLACPLSGGVGTGGQADPLLSDPEAGLVDLDSYRATLEISFTGTLDGGSVTATDSYTQTEWPGQAARFTAIDSTNVSGERQVILTGSVGEAQYYQASSADPCLVAWGTPAGDEAPFRIASLLPTMETAKLAGQESVDGIAARHYTFDAASLGLPEDATADGEAWVAKDGGYVVKYILDMTGSESVFGPGAQGTRHVEYLLTEVNSQADVVYPDGCKPVLTSVPAMDDAAELTRLPALLDYNTSATADQVHTFYTDQLARLGWEELSDPAQSADLTTWTFSNAGTGALAFIHLEAEGDTLWVTVMTTGEGSAAAAASTTPGAPAGSTNPSVRVSMALSILIGMVPDHPAPSSFHLEATNQQPVASGSSIALSQDVMSADIQGANVHFTHRVTNPGGSVELTEAYVIDGQAYPVVNGQARSTPDVMTRLDWTMWPLDLTVMLAGNSSGAAAAGTEVLDGRTAEIYDLDSTSSASSPTGLGVTAVSGRVWIDQETGALLKAVLDYQANVKGSGGSNLGSGTGHLEITVTQVGDVTVALP